MGVLGKGKDEEGAQSNSRKNRKLKKKKTSGFRVDYTPELWLKKKKKKSSQYNNQFYEMA